MPTAFQLVETSFPQPDNKNTEQKIDGIYDYLFILLEQLRYTLFNLDGSNVNQSALSDFIQNISDPIYAKIKDTDENVNELSITAQGLAAAVQDAEGKITVLTLTVDGLTVTDEGGTTRIKGSSIETSTLYVDAAHITGSLVIGQLPGSVAQKGDIPTLTSQLTNNSGFQDASGVVSIVNGTVTADYIYALGVEASVIRGNSVGLKDGNGNTVGAMQLSYTSTGMGIAFLTNQGGIQMQPAGNVFLASGGGAFITLSNVVSLGGAPLVLSSKMYGNTLPSNPVQGTLYFLRKNT